MAGIEGAGDAGLLAWVISAGPAAGAAITASVGLLVASAGWIANTWLARRDARRQRREARHDMLSALAAEIEAHLLQLDGEEALEAHKTTVLDRMDEAPEFVPFVPRTPHDMVFSAYVGRIDLLPTRVVEKVTLHYDQVSSLAALREDMRGEGYARLGAKRRAALFGHYIEMQIEAFRRGRVALAVIDDALAELAAYRN